MFHVATEEESGVVEEKAPDKDESTVETGQQVVQGGEDEAHTG